LNVKRSPVKKRRPVERSLRILATATGLFLSPGAAHAADESLAILNREHVNVLVALVIFGSLFACFLWASRKGKPLSLRRLPGIAAIEEAVGRATEMGRSVLFIPGINEIEDIQTLAGIAVLGHVARMVAEYEASIVVPTRSPIVMSVCEETVRESFLAAGKPDAFQQDRILYLSGEQFAFTAGVDGIMLREKPAANIYLGAFYAESLILAETGYASGAIQVAGTASIHQLPFFITACDYTLIAEEFYAASAYLSKDPRVLSSIKASDYFKIVVIAVLVVGFVLVNFSAKWVEVLKNWF
jgi:hypothetical protein